MFSINDGLSFQVHGGGGHEGGVGAALSDVLVSLDSLSGQSGADVLAALLPGVAGMANLHPLMVHFPIALLVMFFWVELAASFFRQASWRTVASGLLYLGTLCAGVAVYLGLQAAETVAHDEAVHIIMEKHELFGFGVLGLAAFLAVWRWFFNVHKHLGVQVVYLLFAGLLNVLIVFGADLGGLMVYQHGVSVKSNNTPLVGLPEHKHDEASGHSHDHGEHHH
jgi:uncharacterized membrane protein